MSDSFVETVQAEAEAAASAGDAPEQDSGAEVVQATGDDTSAPPDTQADPNADPRIKAFQRVAEDEREKRQLERQLREQTERRLAEMETRIAATQTKQDAVETVEYDKIFEDPKGVLEAHTKALSKTLGGNRMEMSREIARAQFSDYEETIGKLATLQVPGIEEAVAKSQSPAHTAYRMVKEFEHAQAERSKSPEVDALKAQLEETRKELSALRGEQYRPTPSLSQSRAASGTNAQAAKTINSVLERAWGKSY